MFKFLKKKGAKKDQFHAFASGKLVSLDKVPDPVFAEKMMGDGFAIELSEGKIYAPVDGEITLVFPTGHAYGITTDNAHEILIHIGIDTVELDGEGFDVKVAQGDKVKQGDLLAEVDLELIKEKGKPSITPMIFTSGQKIKILKENQDVTPETSELFEIIK